MTEVNTTPTLCTHDHADYDAKADKQYHDLRTGLNAVCAFTSSTIELMRKASTIHQITPTKIKLVTHNKIFFRGFPK